jgi:lipopolysaccharide transport system ATP-binding protein
MISIRQLSKTFKLYKRPSDRLVEWFLPLERHQLFHALRDINLEIPPGRTLGIVGANGAGKSTLLKLITGVLLPTTGTLEVRGRIAALLELGTGFHPEFTGRQNIYVNGQLLGMTYEQMKELEEEIIAFSELGAFIDQPIRTYSSGMYLRLGFSIAACVRPEILIVDEALSVGDARFSQKCIRRIREFRDNGTTILFVSHDPGAVSLLCDEAVLLDKGLMRLVGSPKEVLEEYNAMLAAMGSGNSEMHITRPVRLGGADQPRRHGTFLALITELQTLDQHGEPTQVYAPGDEMQVVIRIAFLAPANNPTVGISFRDRLGQDLYGTNTHLKRVATGRFAPGSALELRVRVRVPFGYGDYSLTTAVHDDENHLDACYEWTDNAAIFSVRLSGKLDWSGLVELAPTIQASGIEVTPVALAEALAQRFPQLPNPITVDGVVPNPFLFGFGPVQHSDGRNWRHLASEGCVVAPITGEYLVVLVENLGQSPVRLEAKMPLENESSEWNIPQGRCALVIRNRLHGKGSVWPLVLNHGGAPDTVRVHQVETIAQWRDSPEWPSPAPARS